MRSNPTWLAAVLVSTLCAGLAACGDGDGRADTDPARRLDQDFAPDPQRKPCGPSGSFVSRLVPERWVGFCGIERKSVGFSDACVAHDACYSRPGADRAACDTAFRAIMDEKCKAAYPSGSDCSTARRLCGNLAGEYYVQVRKRGKEPFRQAQAAAAATPSPAPTPTVEPTPTVAPTPN